MYLRPIGRLFTQMITYFLVMNSKRCNIVHLRFKNTFMKTFFRRRGFFNLTDDSGFLSWILLCIGTYKQIFFLQRIRYGAVITNYHYLNIVNDKKNSKEINCLKSRSALFSENELLMQQQTTKCPETTVIFNSNLKIFCTF